MKTTVEIPSGILEAAKKLARRRKTTLRQLLIEGLRRVLADANQPQQSFKLEDASVGGNGVQPGIRLGEWGTVSDQIYQGRGSGAPQCDCVFHSNTR